MKQKPGKAVLEGSTNVHVQFQFFIGKNKIFIKFLFSVYYKKILKK